MENYIIFDLIVVIDWSAASKPGPKTPSPDRCWIAWENGEGAQGQEYFRTRHFCMERLTEMVQDPTGPILLAFDFPFGYPHGSGLGGGRKVGETLSGYMEDSENDANNRFEVGSQLNKTISDSPGPFWGHPKSQSYQNLTWRKPPFDPANFKEWRLSESLLKSRGSKIMNVWQLLGQGSVGSQTLTGLARLHTFSQRSEIFEKIRFWPFETDWDKNLEGIILAEVWPSLNDFSNIDHPVKDARQVKACVEWLAKKNRDGDIKDLFSAPPSLSLEEQRQCQTEEGWILGVK